METLRQASILFVEAIIGGLLLGVLLFVAACTFMALWTASKAMRKRLWPLKK